MTSQEKDYAGFSFNTVINYNSFDAPFNQKVKYIIFIWKLEPNIPGIL